MGRTCKDQLCRRFKDGIFFGHYTNAASAAISTVLPLLQATCLCDCLYFVATAGGQGMAGFNIFSDSRLFRAFRLPRNYIYFAPERQKSSIAV